MIESIPHNPDLEQWVLGSLVYNPEGLHEVCRIVADTDFYSGTNAQIFQAMRTLHYAGHPVTAVTVDDVLAKANHEQARDALVMILRGPTRPIGEGVAFHAALVRELALKRTLMNDLDQTLRNCADRSKGLRECVESASKAVFGISEIIDPDSTQPVAAHALSAMERIHLRMEGGRGGIGTGFTDLDAGTNGLEPGTVTILAARPSMGKTALALSIADFASMTGDGVLFFSLEMNALDLGERLIIARSGVAGERVRSHADRLNEKELDALSVAYEALRNRDNFCIDARATQTPSQIATVIRKRKQRHGISLVIIDYLQLIDTTDAGVRFGSRQEQVAHVSRQMKAIAKECGVAVLLCAQLNRQADVREDHRPRLSDLRESGQIEQDADLVMFLHRPEYYDPNDQPGIAELIIAKNRNGPTGLVRLTFLKSQMSFGNFYPDQLPAY